MGQERSDKVKQGSTKTNKDQQEQIWTNKKHKGLAQIKKDQYKPTIQIYL